MDTKAKKLWLDALRSGEYQQTRHQLCSASGKMCCLGVLIDVTQDGEWELDCDRTCYSYAGSVGVLPMDVRTRLGITGEDQNALTGMNDDERKGFRQIANWVETNL